jgi:protocatechuate 3,4-dioxygenase beta subunit
MFDEPMSEPPASTTPLLHRRRALGLLGAGVVALVGCSSSSDTATGGTTSTSASAGATTSSAGGTSTSAAGATTTDAAAGSCETIPAETAGPFPGDGSNGPDVLGIDGVVRPDIRTSIGSASGTAEGIPLTLELVVQDGADGCRPIEGAAVYAWHCDRDGNYSMYGSAASENYLRGVQPTDADGELAFTSIYPGAYSGRWPHIHFEVYESVEAATGGGSPIATSQLAFPADVCDEAYATEGYEQSVTNFASMSIESDGIFADGYDQQMAALSGSPEEGYTARLTVTV